jgi:hypothetical protein
MKLYVPPAMADDLGAPIARAVGFLLSAKPWSGDDYGYRLLGLVWTEAKDDQSKAACQQFDSKGRRIFPTVRPGRQRANQKWRRDAH